uniref:Uncharacterized protein n=1 Tax=Parastrongyloides trichosuri TaxID=131310 RepID=A0A0N4ZLY9_PARTI
MNLNLITIFLIIFLLKNQLTEEKYCAALVSIDMNVTLECGGRSDCANKVELGLIYNRNDQREWQTKTPTNNNVYFKGDYATSMFSSFSVTVTAKRPCEQSSFAGSDCNLIYPVNVNDTCLACTLNAPKCNITINMRSRDDE